jgi:adenylate kinase
LIKWARGGEKNWGSNKTVADIESNQEALSKALKLKRNEEKPILLDGHYVLRNSEGRFESISISVFEDIAPSLLLVLIEKPSVIYSRLQERDTSSISLQEIQDFQLLEKEHANNIGQSLSIPVIEVSNPDEEAVAAQISKVLKRKVTDSLSVENSDLSLFS